MRAVLSPPASGTCSDQRAFTLIELMIVVAIIGILAAIAIPNFQSMLLRARRAELPANVDGVRTAEIAYRAEWGAYTSCSLSPTTVPGRSAVSFPATEATSFDWNMLGWLPDGKVRGQYDAIAVEVAANTPTFTANGYSDVDGDGNLARYRTTEIQKPVLLTGNNVY